MDKPLPEVSPERLLAWLAALDYSAEGLARGEYPVLRVDLSRDPTPAERAPAGHEREFWPDEE